MEKFTVVHDEKSWTDDDEWGRHGLQNSRTTTFRFETRAKYQRSRIDSENRERPKSTSSSTRPATESIINPFSPESKQMIHEVGNIELCELFETEPKTQCKVCLSYWDIGIVYCTCGHFLRKGREENQNFIKYTMDLLSIPDCYIKKRRPHGHRYGKKPGDKEYYIANQLKKKKCKKRDFQGIHDRFKRDEQFRNRMIEIGRKRRSLPTNGCSCGRRSYTPFDHTRIFLLQK